MGISGAAAICQNLQYIIWFWVTYDIEVTLHPRCAAALQIRLPVHMLAVLQNVVLNYNPRNFCEAHTYLGNHCRRILRASSLLL